MASLKVIKRDSFKRGDTVVFEYDFDAPYVGYNWAAVVVTCVLTAVAAPTDNTSAAASRINQPLTVNADGSATYLFQLTHAESAALIPGTTYTDECQLIESGTNYLTPVQGETTIAQDYAI